jgi:Avidin family
MLLIEAADHGLSGIYHSIVGRDPGYRALAGRASPQDGPKQMAAFTVCFEIADPSPGYGHNSVCGWSGWNEIDDNGASVIKTHWLLSVNVLDPKAEWSATYVGEDTFSKIYDAPDDKLFKDMDALKELHAKARGQRR